MPRHGEVFECDLVRPTAHLSGERRLEDGVETTRRRHDDRVVFVELLRDESRHVSILLGGPGSGKTFTLAKDLIEVCERSATPPRIALAAPTGKAAARMTKALEDRCLKFRQKLLKFCLERFSLPMLL